MGGHRPDITTRWDQITILPNLGLALGRILFAAVTGPFRGPDNAATYGEYLKCATLRNLIYSLTAAQMQMLMPPSVDAYKSWAAKNNVAERLVQIPNTGVYGFWLGADVQSAKYHIIYFHGGGFALPMSPQHIDLFLRIIKWSKAPIAIFAVCYTLSPGAVYPQALAECVESVRYVLEQPGVKVETTFLGGDSAGGNLALAILSHIVHPHPNSAIVAPLNLGDGQEFGGAICLTPWTSADKDRFQSMLKWNNRDIIQHASGTYWMNCYKTGLGRVQMQKDDNYICAVLAPSSWWKDLPVKKVLVTAGEQELLIDAIDAWVKTFKEGFPGEVEYVVGKGEYHDKVLDALPESILNSSGQTSTEGALKNWVGANLI